MNNYKCPECGNVGGIEENGRSKSFHCLYDSCGLPFLKFRDYNKIAAAILGKPFNPVDDGNKLPSRHYVLPPVIADKVLELVYVIDSQRKDYLEVLDESSKTKISQMKKDGRLEIVLDEL